MTAISEAIQRLLGERYLATGGHVVWYGSRRSGRDIDLLLLHPEETATPMFVAGELDVVAMSRAKFIYLTGLLDPVVVEPLLTGQHLAGDKREWYSFVDSLRGVSPTIECIRHALGRSCYCNRTALDYYQDFVEGSRVEFLKWAFVNLSFSVSYLSFATHYVLKRPKGGSTLVYLIKTSEILLPEFWDWYSRAKAQESAFTADSFEDWEVAWLPILRDRYAYVEEIIGANDEPRGSEDTDVTRGAI